MPTLITSRANSAVFSSPTKLALLAALIGALTLSAVPALGENLISWSWGSGKMIRGSGNVVERTMAVSAFDNVAVQDGIRVVLRRGATQKILVKADDNILPLVEANIDGSRLLLRIQPNTSAQTKSGIVVTVDYISLYALTLKDGARGELDAASGSTFRAVAKDGSTLTIAEASATDFELSVSDGANAAVSNASPATSATSATSQRYKVSDGARLTVNRATGDHLAVVVADGASATMTAINVAKIEVKVSDGATLNVAGIAQQQKFSLADGAAVTALRLQGNSAQVRAIDGSTLKLGIVKTLNADVQDGSSLHYSGDPAVTVNSRDAASIKKI